MEKEKQMKKFLSVLLILLMVVTALPKMVLTVNADFEYVIIDNIVYVLDKDTNKATVAGRSGVLPENVIIQSEIISNDRKFIVTFIGNNAFENCENLSNIEIPDSVTGIGESAFKNSNLQNIKVPDSVIEMYSEVFCGCRELRTVELSNNPEFKFNLPGMFKNCNLLTNIKIPKNVTDICREAFYGSGITNVEILDGLKAIGGSAFADCRELETISLPNSLAFIQDGAFANSGIKRISLPSNLKYLGCGAFESSELTTVEFPDDYKFSVIKQVTFKNCRNLKQVIIPPGVSKIEVGAFANSGLELAMLPEGIVVDVKSDSCMFRIGKSDREKGSFFGCRNLTIRYRSDVKPV